MHRGPLQLYFFLKKGGIYELGSHSIQFALFMEMAGYGTCFSFKLHYVFKKKRKLRVP